VIVGFFFSLWYSLPKSSDVQRTFETIPSLFSVYCPLLLLRVALSRKYLLADWAILIFMLIDFLAVTALILSFHLQYQQAPAFSLKVPMYGMFFIFVSFNLIRDRVIFIISSGAMASASWLGLVCYAYVNNNPISRSFVEYSHGNSLLIGAEVEKVVYLLGFSAISAFAVWRFHHFFMNALKFASEAQVLNQFFNEDFSDLIRKGGSDLKPGKGYKRTSVVFFSDLRGFTQFTKTAQDDDLMGLLNNYHRLTLQNIEHFGGHIEKFHGDGVLAYFPYKGVDSTVFASFSYSVELLLSYQVYSQENENITTQLNISLCLGEILIAVVGDETKLEFTILGDVVNLGARLEKHMKGLGVSLVMDNAFFESLREQTSLPIQFFQCFKDQQIEGVPEALTLWGCRSEDLSKVLNFEK
jgi:adenylate cyclase